MRTGTFLAVHLHCILLLQSSSTWYGQQPWEGSEKSKLEMETQVNWGVTNSTTSHDEEPPPYTEVTDTQQQPQEQPEVFSRVCFVEWSETLVARAHIFVRKIPLILLHKNNLKINLYCTGINAVKTPT